MSTSSPPKRSRRGAALLARALSANRKLAATRQAYRWAALAEEEAALDRLVAANVLFTASYYARCGTLLSELGRRRLRRTVQPVGDHHLRRATTAGRGAILLAVHLGDFDLAGHWVASKLGRQLVVASKPVRPVWRAQLYGQVRTKAGFRVRRQDQTTLSNLAEDLASGHLVLFLADRCPLGRPLRVTFLGRASVLSAGPSWLSAGTGAPILTAVTFKTGGRRFLRFGLPRWAAEPSDHRWVRDALAELEFAIRLAPEQWHVPAEFAQLAFRAAGASGPGDRQYQADDTPVRENGSACGGT